jgi:hypothetical protein
MNGRIRIELEIPSIASKSNGQPHTWKIDIRTGIVKTPIREPGGFSTFYDNAWTWWSIQQQAER